MRTASPSLMHRHGRPYAEDTCLVRRGGDHSTLTETAHNHRFPAKRWLVALLDRREEGVEVGVEDGGLGNGHEQMFASVPDAIG